LKRALAMAIVAAACGPVAGDPPSDVPLNACPANACDAYKPFQAGGASAQCKAGICQVSAKLDFTLVVSLPESSYYAPGTSFVLPAAHLFDHPSATCPAGQCSQLPGLAILEGGYQIDPDVQNKQVHYYVGDGAFLPVSVTYRLLAGTPLVDATSLNIPIDASGSSTISIVGVSGPLGGPAVGYRAILPPGTYERTVAPTPPFDGVFPPDVSVVDVQPGIAGFDRDELSSVDQLTAPSGPPQVTLRRDDGATLDAWTVRTRDTRSLRRLSNAIVLGPSSLTQPSPAKYAVQLNMHHHQSDALSGIELVLDPPAGTAATPSLLFGFLADLLNVPSYPNLPAPATVRGFVASTISNAPVAADIELIATKIYVSAGSNQNTNLAYTAHASADLTPDGSAARYSLVLPRGEYQVVVTPRDSAYAKRVLPQPFIVDAINDPQDGKNLAVTRKRLVKGSALVSDGRPLAHAQVVATAAASSFSPIPPNAMTTATPIAPSLAPRAAQATVDATGAFQLELDPGSYDITIRPVQGSKLPWVVSPSRVIADADVTLDPLFVPAPVSAGLTLLDPSSPPNPVVGAIVRAFAMPTGGTAFVEIGRAMTDAKGRYEMFLAGTPH
jgi:hypothetical protein